MDISKYMPYLKQVWISPSEYTLKKQIVLEWANLKILYSNVSIIFFNPSKKDLAYKTMFADMKSV